MKSNNRLFLAYFQLFLDKVFDYYCAHKKSKKHCGDQYREVEKVYSTVSYFISQYDEDALLIIQNTFQIKKIRVGRVITNFLYYLANVLLNDPSYRSVALLLRYYGFNTLGLGPKRGFNTAINIYKRKCLSIEECLIRSTARIIFGATAL